VDLLVNYPGGRFAGVAASGDNREQMMHKAFEYEVKFGKDGRPVERRWSVGPVFITTCATVLLALTGHSIWIGIGTVLKSLRW
jgi:hypothetical protein